MWGTRMILAMRPSAAYAAFGRLTLSLSLVTQKHSIENCQKNNLNKRKAKDMAYAVFGRSTSLYDVTFL